MSNENCFIHLHQIKDENNLILYNMNKSNFLSVALLTGMMVLSASALFAGPPPSSTPIDGGLSLVLGSCAIYGAKKIRDSRKKN